MDYGKFKFDEAQRAKESRRKSTNVSLKEMKYRLKIGPGDFDTKTRKVAGFLAEGHKVKITIMFRGREVERPQQGKDILDRVADKVASVGKVEMVPRLDGRNMVMVLSPDKRAQAAAQHAARPPGGERTGAVGSGHEPDGTGTPAPHVEDNGRPAPDSDTPTQET
jgi:translation initiation factor IF-3